MMVFAAIFLPQEAQKLKWVLLIFELFVLFVAKIQLTSRA
jgi:hypothetical protein